MPPGTGGATGEPPPRRRRLIGLYRPEVAAETIVADILEQAQTESVEPQQTPEPSSPLG